MTLDDLQHLLPPRFSHTCPYCGLEVRVDNVRSAVAHEAPSCPSWLVVVERTEGLVIRDPDFEGAARYRN